MEAVLRNYLISLCKSLVENTKRSYRLGDFNAAIEMISKPHLQFSYWYNEHHLNTNELNELLAEHFYPSLLESGIIGELDSYFPQNKDNQKG